uniref:NAD-dependent epimerase/dehydratase family protein n=1 Tax=candidate division WOR-3 bacterium TaxID=2052148 RepID=A0A7C3NDH2_UNCW3
MKKLKIKSALLLGGLGFIGYNLSKYLIENGVDVTIIDSKNGSSGYNEFHMINLRKEKINIIEDSIGNVEKYKDQIKNTDCVVDLAALISHSDSMKNPLFDIENNTIEHIKFLEVFKSFKNKKVVYISTRQVYGKQEKFPVDESSNVNPVDVNGINKYATEMYYSLYSRYYGFPLTILRLSNIYGEGMHIKDKRLSFIGWFLNRVITNNPIELYSDGSTLRDLLYVKDLVRTIYNSMIVENTGIFNVGSDYSYSLKSIAEKLVKLNPKSSIIYIPFPDEIKNIDIGSFKPDNSKAKEFLNHKEETLLDEGLKNTYEYYQKYKGYYL